MPNLKNKKVIKDQQGQRKYPGRVTKIQGNTMATTGYGDIPLYVVPNVGNPMVVPANIGNIVFPGASSFTEYPIAKNGGWLEKYQVGGKTRTDVYKDKELYDKAFAAESDSLNLYKSAKKDFNRWNKLGSRFHAPMSDAEWQKTSDQYHRLLDLQEKKWHTSAYKTINGSDVDYGPRYTVNYKYKGPESGLTIKPVGLEGFYREGYDFPRFKKPVVHNVYQEPELEPVKTQVVNIPNPIDKDRTEVNFGQKYKTYVYKGEKNPRYFDPTTKNEIDVSKSFDLKGNYIPVYLEQKKYGGLLEKYGDGGKTLEQKINKALGDPRKKAADAAINKKWFNKETKKWEVEDDTDNFRHPMAARYTAEAIANKFPDWMKYSGIPQVAGFVGSTALGVGHELANNKYTSNDPKDYPNYTFWDTVSEAGEDAFNNIVGAGVGVLPISDDKKTSFLKYLSDNNMLPDGLANKKEYGGWLEKYGDGGLKSVTGPAPKFDAKTEAEGKRIASGYNNANKQNAEISQTRNWSQADQEHSDRVKARINNPASDVGILAANMASNLTRFRNLTPEEIARVTDNVGETVNLSSGIATDALTNELVGYGASKAIPFVSKSAKSAGKYLTEETALKNAYKLNPYAFKPNPESYYRMVGKEGIKDATESGIIRANQKIPLADNGEPFGDLITPEFEDAYFSKSRPFDGREYGKTPWYGKYEGPGMIEVKNKDYFKPLSKHIDYIGLPKSTIKTSDEAIKFYKEHWLQGYKEVPKELPGSSNKINTKKMWRIENPNIKFNPSKVANENAQQEHVGNWFSDDINYVSDYLRKNQKVPGSRLAEVNVPESELSKYHISNYPDMKDVEPRNWLIPDAFNRNYTDLSHLPISGGNLSKIKENQNYIKELVNKKIAEKKYGGWLDTYEDGGETDPPVNLRSASTQLASPVSTQAPEVPLNKTGWDWVKQKYENKQPSEWNMLMMDKSGSYVDSGVDPFSLMLTAPQQVIKAGVKGGKALLDANKNNKIKSEIDWSKWNKEIPENTKLMKEYNTIEQTSKANGTWMKNPDGSAFNGTSEQFVQQNSENFKKAFPNPVLNDVGDVQINYHGSPNKFESFDKNKFNNGQYGKGIYTTTNKDIVLSGYAKPRGAKAENTVLGKDGHLYELYLNSKNPKVFDTMDDFLEHTDYQDITNFGKTMDDYLTLPELKEKYKETLKNYSFKNDEELESFIGTAFGNKNQMKSRAKLVMPDVDFIRFDDSKLRPQVTPFHASPPKSAIGNNGMFDMTNPNIYKAAIPIGLGVAASQNKQDNSQWLNKYK